MCGDRYTTDPSYKEFEQMRVSMEPLTYQYGVDLFFYGAPLPPIMPSAMMSLATAACYASSTSQTDV